MKLNLKLNLKKLASRLTLSLGFLLLVGCASFDAQLPNLPEPEHGTLILVEYLKHNKDGSVFLKDEYNGIARYYNASTKFLNLPKIIKKCDISVRDYPRAMGHEITHCFSGNFHDKPETDHFKYSDWD